MEISLVLAICFLVLILNSLPFIIGALATPANTVYLGTVHWAGDYFSYLAQMAQGRDNLLFARILHTAEKLPETIIGWQMVLIGKICLLLGINVIYGYQIAVVIFTLFFLILSYLLISLIFPDSKGKKLLAFFFLATSTAFFKVSYGLNGFVWSYYDYWYNTGNALERFAHTPHHAIANGLAVAMMLFTVYWVKDKISLIGQIGLIGGSVMAGAALCSITPVHWILVGGGLGLAIVIYNFKSHHALLCCKKIIWQLLPVLFYIFAGILVVFYLKDISSQPPYPHASAWEAGQQLNMSFYWLLVGSGLVVPLAFFGIYPFIRKLSFPRLLSFCFILFCAIFYFTLIPQRLHLTNARFWPTTVYIFISVLAAEGFFFLSSSAKKYKKGAFILLLIIYLISIIPTYIMQLSDKLKPKIGNAYVYLPKDMITAYQAAEKMSDRDSLFLVQWPMNLSFPGITGRRTFHGYDPTTIDYATKDREAYDFFAGNLNEEEMEALLDKYNIDYVLGYWWNPKLDKFGRLKRVYSNPVMAIDKVVR